MDAFSKHIIILPYYCESEVARYLKIADRISSFPTPQNGYHFLLAASPRIRPSRQLHQAFEKIGNTLQLQCTTEVFGYPQGPTAMFWDCMDYLATHFSGHRGFGLWLESDMVPTQPNWIDRLSNEWFGDQASTELLQPTSNEGARTSSSVLKAAHSTPLMMGCYVPQVFKPRILKKKKLILNAHINGGACYSLDFAKYMPTSVRSGVFDMAVFDVASSLGRIRSTQQIAFSNLRRVRRDLFDTSKVLLHGFMQDKDKFVEQCCRPLSEREKRAAVWNPWLETWETWRRRIRVHLVRHGANSMLENMYLAKKNFDQQQALEQQAKLKKVA